MLAEKSRNLANGVAKRPAFVALCCLLLVFSLAGFAFSSSAQANAQPEIMIVGPYVQTYDLEADQWDFHLTLAGFGPGPGTARLVEFSIGGHDLLPIVPEAQKTMNVHRLDKEIDRENFRKWINYQKRASILRVRDDESLFFSPAEAHEFREGSSRVLDVMRQRGEEGSEIDPAVLAVDVSELPFAVTADGHYKVSVVVEKGQERAAWAGEILVVDVEPLVTNPVWLPADLHLHSTFSLDGGHEPRELAPRLANKGYSIGYITDEPVGWGIAAQSVPPRMSGTGRQGSKIESGTNKWLEKEKPNRQDHLPWLATWETYRDTVRAASTSRVALFPGAEISASHVYRRHITCEKTSHNGHALAYGIRDLIGRTLGSPGTFETTGLRYNWHLPFWLLENISNNNNHVPSSTPTDPNPPGPSSGAIAHPIHLGFPDCLVPSYPWSQWESDIRYQGYEIMFAGQGIIPNPEGAFGPEGSAASTWRRELAFKMPAIFRRGGTDFPSVRTGSDWGGAGSRLWDISYYTFIRVSSHNAGIDMSQLSQSEVDFALRNGRTVASRLGGLATLTLLRREIGSMFTWRANTEVSGHIELRAARSGTYRVRIIENWAGNAGINAVQAFQNKSASSEVLAVSAGQTVTIPVSFNFPGGQRSYHVVVEQISSFVPGDRIVVLPNNTIDVMVNPANDIIYTSPIFIRQ
jgi:hypothetical protein